jgi:hypothetical protein
VVSRRAGRRGGSTLGCIVSLALFAAALYYGERVGRIYLRYYQFRDAMRVQAELAPSLDDGVIRRRLTTRADSLFGGKVPRIQIRRGGRPPRVTIQATYSESVDLPFFKRTLVFKPKVEAGL